tara:strand:+ start:397 stop:834 length:438 start_codon:yes stop_codon:yes gene_type:complete
MINIVYASEMGTAFELALDFESNIKDQGLEVECGEMDDYTVEQLSEMKNVMMLCSTTGDGDVPMMGENLWAELENSSVDLSNVNYSMCALGDSSHSTFCGAGRKIDARMQELGAKVILERHECDADTDGSEEWAETLVEKFKAMQ